MLTAYPLISGETPLFYALRELSSLPAARLLLEAGALPQHRNSDGESAASVVQLLPVSPALPPAELALLGQLARYCGVLEQLPTATCLPLKHSTTPVVATTGGFSGAPSAASAAAGLWSPRALTPVGSSIARAVACSAPAGHAPAQHLLVGF